METIGQAIVNRTKRSVLAVWTAVADTPRSRRRGLLGTHRLEDGHALLIFPCRQVHTIGMRYPIDVVFVDELLRVLRVAEGMKPWRLGAPVLDAVAVIELPAGKAEATGTAPGDRLEILPPSEEVPLYTR